MKMKLFTTFMAAILCGAMLTACSPPKAEMVKGVQIPDGTIDPAVWGKAYPGEYETWKKTAEATPVGVGALGDDLALLHEALEHALHVQDLGLLGARTAATRRDAKREVLEVDEDGERMCLVGHGVTFRCVSAAPLRPRE